MVKVHTRTRTMLAWSLWLATFGCCAGGLLVTLALTRPLTIGVLAEGAAFALAFPLGFATVGLLVTLRRPANPDRLAVRGRRRSRWASPCRRCSCLMDG